MPSVRERLIEATVELIRRHGVAGVGVTEIVKRSEVARRSLYWNFPGGKEELVAAATRHAGTATTTALHAVVADDDPLLAFVDAWKRLVHESDYEGGCAVSAAAFGRRDAPEAADVASEMYSEWATVLADRYERVELMDTTTAAALAATVVAAMEGALLIARAARDTTALDAVADQLRLLVAVQSEGAPKDQTRPL